MMNDKIVKIELTVDETNQILFALSEKPYKEVFVLIAKIKGQVEPQVQQVRP